jgi:hypothetical protein
MKQGPLFRFRVDLLDKHHFGMIARKVQLNPYSSGYPPIGEAISAKYIYTARPTTTRLPPANQFNPASVIRISARRIAAKIRFR